MRAKRQVFDAIMAARCADEIPPELVAHAAAINTAAVRAAVGEMRAGWSWGGAFGSRPQAIAARLRFDFSTATNDAGRIARVARRSLTFRAILRAFEKPRASVVGYARADEVDAVDTRAGEVVDAALADPDLAPFRAWACRYMAMAEYLGPAAVAPPPPPKPRSPRRRSPPPPPPPPPGPPPAWAVRLR